MDFGKCQYISWAMFDIVSKNNPLTKEQLLESLVSFGFTRDFIIHYFNYINIPNVVTIADLSMLQYNNLSDLCHIAITYPFYDSRGIVAKNTHSLATVPLMDSIQALIMSAKWKIVILSPYIEVDGMEYIGELLKRKMKMNVKVSLIIREYSDNNVRIKKLLRWLSINFGDDPNFSLYDYHYVSDDGIVESTCHAKAVVVDSEYAYVGSADIRFRAFYKNFEIGFVEKGYPALVISSLLDTIIEVSKKQKIEKYD